MHIQVNAVHQVEGHAGLVDYLHKLIESSLSHVRDHVTRVEVHLTDENANKGGDNDKKCVMEARMEGRQPVAVHHLAGTVDQAIGGAIEKLSALLEKQIAKQRDLLRHTNDPILPGEVLPEAI